MCVFLSVCLSIMCVQCLWRSEHEVRSHVTGITVVSCHVDAGNHNWGLSKNSNALNCWAISLASCVYWSVCVCLCMVYAHIYVQCTLSHPQRPEASFPWARFLTETRTNPVTDKPREPAISAPIGTRFTDACSHARFKCWCGGSELRFPRLLS